MHGNHKHVTTGDDIARPVHPSHLIGSRLCAWAGILRTWFERSRQRKALAELDDRLLDDIGRSRSEAQREAAKPFWYGQGMNQGATPHRLRLRGSKPMADIARAKLNPAGEFERPMDVIAVHDLPTPEKVAILRAWEADERALQRAEDEGMGGGEHAHLHRVQEALMRLREEPLN